MKTMTVQVKLFFALLSLSIPVLGSVGCSDRTAEYQEFFERGNAYQAEGRDSEAIIEYRNALQADPNQAAAHEALARSYLNAEQAEKAFWGIRLGATLSRTKNCGCAAGRWLVQDSCGSRSSLFRP